MKCVLLVSAVIVRILNPDERIREDILSLAFADYNHWVSALRTRWLYSGDLSGRDRLGRSFFSVFLRSLNSTVCAFYGGSRLDNPLVTEFLRRLMLKFARRGWSLVGGGGPGLMEESLRALHDSRTTVSRHRVSPLSKLFVVLSGLVDEDYCGIGDDEVTVRPQPQNEAREAMIARLSNLADFVFIGSWGSVFEGAEAIIRNYVSLRVKNGAARSPRPIIFIDSRNEKFRSGTFYGPLIDLANNMAVEGVGKGVDVHAYRFFVEDANSIGAIIALLEQFAQKGEFATSGYVLNGPFLELAA